MERGEVPAVLAPVDASPPVAHAVGSYIDDCRVRKLAKSTITRYKTTLDALAAHFHGRMSAVTVESLGEFRAARAEVAGASASMELNIIRTFLRFAMDRNLRLPPGVTQTVKTQLAVR